MKQWKNGAGVCIIFGSIGLAGLGALWGYNMGTFEKIESAEKVDRAQVSQILQADEQPQIVELNTGKKAGKEADDSSLIGVWHASPSVAACYDDLFFFYADHTFKFMYSQVYEAKRTIDFSGNWKLYEDEIGKKIKLSITTKTVIQGGSLELAMPDTISKYKIADGKTIKKSLKVPEIRNYDISQIEEATDSPYEWKVFIDNKPYWLMLDDPAQSDSCLEF